MTKQLTLVNTDNTDNTEKTMTNTDKTMTPSTVNTELFTFTRFTPVFKAVQAKYLESLMIDCKSLNDFLTIAKSDKKVSVDFSVMHCIPEKNKSFIRHCTVKQIDNNPVFLDSFGLPVIGASIESYDISTSNENNSYAVIQYENIEFKVVIYPDKKGILPDRKIYAVYPKNLPIEKTVIYTYIDTQEINDKKYMTVTLGNKSYIWDYDSNLKKTLNDSDSNQFKIIGKDKKDDKTYNIYSVVSSIKL